MKWLAANLNVSLKYCLPQTTALAHLSWVDLPWSLSVDSHWSSSGRDLAALCSSTSTCNETTQTGLHDFSRFRAFLTKLLPNKGVFLKLRVNKFAKLVKLANAFNHWPKFWWELNPVPKSDALQDMPLSFVYHLCLKQSPVLCITMHDWFCQIELIESIWQNRELVERGWPEKWCNRSGHVL